MRAVGRSTKLQRSGVYRYGASVVGVLAPAVWFSPSRRRIGLLWIWIVIYSSDFVRFT